MAIMIELGLSSTEGLTMTYVINKSRSIYVIIYWSNL